MNGQSRNKRAVPSHNFAICASIICRTSSSIRSSSPRNSSSVRPVVAVSSAAAVAAPFSYSPLLPPSTAGASAGKGAQRCRGSEPSRRSACRASFWPKSAASQSAVPLEITPPVSVWLAPPRTSASIASTSSQLAAQCNALSLQSTATDDTHSSGNVSAEQRRRQQRRRRRQQQRRRRRRRRRRQQQQQQE